MDSTLRQHGRAIERGEYARIFGLLRKVAAPKPKPARMLLAKSLPAGAVIPKAKPKARPVIMRQPRLTDRELAVYLGDACVRGLISGTIALQVQQDIDAGRRMPTPVRALLERAYGGRR